MAKKIIIRKSRISGKGVFASRDFKKGEVVLKWKPKVLTKTAVDKLPKKQKIYILHIGGKYLLMQSPEKYVNHSCQPNTAVKNMSDVALKNIRKGKEITSNYGGQGIISFKCKCGSKKCRKFVK